MNVFVNLSLTILFFSTAAVFALVPPSHNVKGIIHLVNQDVDISFEGWYDPKGQRSRVDYFDGVTKSYQLIKPNKRYIIVPASDGDKNFKACYNDIGSNILQPTIPTKIDRTNATKDEVNGIPCTLYTEVTEIDNVTDLKKYWVFENGRLEIPVRYEFKSNGRKFPSLHHYFIDYHDYKEALIPPKIFEVDPRFVSVCSVSAAFHSLNPMSGYVDHITSRAEVIRLNLDFIDRVNNAGLDYKLGINKFIDWTYKRYLTLFHAKPLPLSNHNELEPYPSENDRVPVKLPEELDLRKLGLVTPVKDQLISCVSSYAFAAAGALEGAYCRKYKTLITLSEQAIVDCARTGRNLGCFGDLGGYSEDVFSWARGHAVPPYSEYYRKYSGIANYCVLSTQFFNITVKGHRFVQSKNIEALKQALVDYGPVAVIINALEETFKGYSSGVYTDPKCLSGHPNHSVLVIGYGVENGTSYWLIKNSWGTTWGKDGYIKISQRNNLCGVLDRPIFPIVN